MIGKARCATCTKEKGILKCEGCLQSFCYNHALNHRQELTKQMEDIESTCNLVRQSLTDQTIDVHNHSIIEKINQWEYQSIKKVRQIAEESREILLKHITERFTDIEVRLNLLFNQLQQSREENDYYETDLRQWKANLARLEEDLHNKLCNVKLREDSTPIVTNITIDAFVPKLLIPQLSLPDIKRYRKWTQDGITIAGGNGSGNDVSQLYNPVSVYIHDNDHSIYIADHWNNRVMKWKRDAVCGQIVVDGTVQITPTNRLNCPGDVIIDENSDSLIISDIGNRQIVQWPRHNGTQGKIILSDIECWGLAMDKSGYLYVPDYNRHEVKRWRIGDTNGTVVAGGNKSGNRLNQLNSPTNIFVDHEQSVYVSDRFNHRVMKWTLGAKEGILVGGNQTEGAGMAQLSDPTGIVVDQWGTVYVADSTNHRVMSWSKKSTKGTIVIGRSGHGEQSNQLYNPRGLSVDRQGNLYVVDNSNHRIQQFKVDSSSNS